MSVVQIEKPDVCCAIDDIIIKLVVIILLLTQMAKVYENYDWIEENIII